MAEHSNYGRWERTPVLECAEWRQVLDFGDGVSYRLFVAQHADDAYSPTVVRIEEGTKPQRVTGELMPTFGEAAHWSECQGVARVDALAAQEGE